VATQYNSNNYNIWTWGEGTQTSSVYKSVNEVIMDYNSFVKYYINDFIESKLTKGEISPPKTLDEKINLYTKKIYSKINQDILDSIKPVPNLDYSSMKNPHLFDPENLWSKPK